MGVISYEVPINVQRMTIGVQGENNVREFLFDVTEWRQLTGDIGAAEMVVQRNGDASPYAAVITMHDENTVSWVPTSTDTEKVGAGKLQLMWIAGGQTVKTKIFDMKVDPSLDYAVPDTSLDPWASWMPGIINADAKYRTLDSKVTTTQNEINQLEQQLTSPFNFKGTVADLAALNAISNPAQNDTYYVVAEKCRYSWTGSAWKQSSMDESDYEDELASLKSVLEQQALRDLFAQGLNGLFLGSGSTRISSRYVTRRGNQFTVMRDGAGSSWGFHALTGVATVNTSANPGDDVWAALYSAGCFVKPQNINVYSAINDIGLLLQVSANGVGVSTGYILIVAVTEVDENTQTYKYWKGNYNVSYTPDVVYIDKIPAWLTQHILLGGKICICYYQNGGLTSARGTMTLTASFVPAYEIDEYSLITTNIEKTFTASKAYSVGDFIIIEDTLYSVIADIEQGGTIARNTNVQATTIGAFLASLNDYLSDEGNPWRD